MSKLEIDSGLLSALDAANQMVIERKKDIIISIFESNISKADFSGVNTVLTQKYTCTVFSHFNYRYDFCGIVGNINESYAVLVSDQNVKIVFNYSEESDDDNIDMSSWISVDGECTHSDECKTGRCVPEVILFVIIFNLSFFCNRRKKKRKKRIMTMIKRMMTRLMWTKVGMKMNKIRKIKIS